MLWFTRVELRFHDVGRARVPPEQIAWSPGSCAIIAHRYISAGGALLLSAAVASVYTVDVVSNPTASAEEVASHEIAEPHSSAPPGAATRKVRVIDISAENAVISDRTKWHERARKPPIQKSTARAEVAPPVEVRAVEKPKKKTVRHAAPPTQDTYSAYASEPTPRRGGFGLLIGEPVAAPAGVAEFPNLEGAPPGSTFARDYGRRRNRTAALELSIYAKESFSFNHHSSAAHHLQLMDCRLVRDCAGIH